MSIEDGTIMEVEDLWDAIEPTNQDEKIETWKDEMALAKIHESVSEDVLPLLAGVETAKEAWEMLGNLKTTTVEEILELRMFLKEIEEEEKKRVEMSEEESQWCWEQTLTMHNEEESDLRSFESFVVLGSPEDGAHKEETAALAAVLFPAAAPTTAAPMTIASPAAAAPATALSPAAASATALSPATASVAAMFPAATGATILSTAASQAVPTLQLDEEILNLLGTVTIRNVGVMPYEEEVKSFPLRRPRSEHEMKMFHSWERESESERQLKMVVFEEGRANGVLVQEVGDSMRTGVIDSKLLFASIVNNLENFDKVPKGLMGTEMGSLEVKRGGLNDDGPNDIINEEDDEDFVWDPG